MIAAKVADYLAPLGSAHCHPVLEDEDGTVALEVASTNDPLREATADVFEKWFGAATAYFAQAGIPTPRARELAIEMLCAMEGAFVFCRAMRSTEALEVAGAATAAAVREALAAAGRDG